MGCATDTYRTSIGLFESTLMQILQKRATKAAKRARQQKLQAILTLLAALTLLSLLTRERNPARALKKSWTECEEMNRRLTVLFVSNQKQ